MKLMDKIAILAALKFRIDFCITKMSEPDVLDGIMYPGVPLNKDFWGKELVKFQSAYKAAEDFKWE